MQKMKLIKTKYLMLILLSPFFLSGQEYDKAFLDSLPEGIRADLLGQMEEKEQLEEVQYRRPTTFIEKPAEGSDRFGHKIFSMMQTTLMPLNEPNMDGNYILDFGDVLEVQMVGQKTSINRHPINRDGSVSMPEIGKIFLSGLSLNKASDLIKARIEASFFGVNAFVSLVNVRDIQVIIAGNAYNPGPYVLNGNSNIFHSLAISGGPSEDGSYRSIDLIRDNKIIDSIDLYQTFIYGKSSFNTRLRSGDIVFINPVINIVNVSGSVKRPGEYELKANENLNLALEFSNGVDKYADKSNIKLERILDGRIKPIKIINVTQFNQILSNDGDRVFIRSFPFRNIIIEGAVLNPGTYLMNEGDTIFDAISKSGGYSKNAYPRGGVYENEETKIINDAAKDVLYKSFLSNILSIGNQGTGGEEIPALIAITEELRDSVSSGRVIADFIDINQENPINVQDGDKITIPEYINQVYVYGEVSSQGSVKFISGKSYEYYLEKKGGLGTSADKKAIFVLSPNGETIKLNLNRNIFQKQNNIVEVYPGSIIFVPQKISNEYSTRLRAQAYATILSSLGVSLASLSLLKD